MSSFNDSTVSLSHRQLQDECRKAELSASGTSQVLRRRLRGWNLSQKANKRQKSAADDLVCPITLDLPFEPVVAEDGRVYERSAIEQHFEANEENIKSPVTNESIGRKLFPSPQIKNLVETLVETRVITGDLADSWKKKEKKKKDMEDLLREAEGGDMDAIYTVGYSYNYGVRGFKQDYELAYKWLEKAHNAGIVRATARVGYYLMIGRGVAKNAMQGMVFTTMAAERGSDLAAWRLGCAFAKGNYDLSVDTDQAIFWLRRCLSDDCQHKHLSRSRKREARSELQELENAIDEPTNANE